MGDVGDRSQEQVFQDDLKEIMQALGMEVHARAKSPHRVVQEEVIPYALNLRLRQEELEEFIWDIQEKCQEMGFATNSWYSSPPIDD